MRVVVDANVIAAAVLRPAGPTRGLLRSRRAAWFAPRVLLAELAEHEAEFAARTGAPVTRWRDAVRRIGEGVEWVPSGKLRRHMPRARRITVHDPDDAQYVACALAVKADFLWTHDRRLAAVSPVPAGSWPMTDEERL